MALILLPILALLSASGALLYRHVNLLAERSLWVAHTEEVLLEAEQVFSLLKDVETGARGYLLTRDPRFLAPMEVGEAQLRTHLTRLAQLSGEGQLFTYRMTARTQDRDNYQRLAEALTGMLRVLEFRINPTGE